MLHNVLQSAHLLAEAIRSFNDRCARGIEPNVKRIKWHLDNSLMLVTALNPRIAMKKPRRFRCWPIARISVSRMPRSAI